MIVLAYIVTYLALAVFLVAVILRIRQYAKTPMHLRWELYPVAHEGKKASYGGSYYEESEWWNRPREKDMVAEVKAMAKEILFLVALKENNPKMWLRSYPFHLGLYLSLASLALMGGLGLIYAFAGLELLASGFHDFAWTVVSILGVAGMGLGLIGAAALLHIRLTDPDLADFTSKADVFNLGWFVVAFALGLIVALGGDGGAFAFFTYNLVAFSPGAMADLGALAGGTTLPMLSVIVFSALLAYIPLTHMAHFIAKYFAYHAIRWADEPNLRGGDEEKVIGEALARPVSWAGPHVRSNGKKTWAEVAMDITKPEEGK